MPLPADTIAYALELLDPLGGLTTRNMMGGLCIYHDGQIFAILDSSGTLLLKAKGEFAAKLESHGAVQFGDGTSGTMGYWTLPDDALEDSELACDWSRQALQNI